MTKQANIRSKTARAKLKHQNEPYWESIRRGLNLGYRTSLTGVGTWVGRLYRDKKYHFHTIENRSLDFEAARKLVEQWADAYVLTGGDAAEMSMLVTPGGSLVTPARQTGAKATDMTVTQVCESYLCWLESKGKEKAASDAEGRFKRLVYNLPIGNTIYRELTTHDVQRWLNAQRLKGPKYRQKGRTKDEEERTAKDSANRNLKSLKAALNYGKKEIAEFSEIIPVWSKVKMFEDVEARRDGYLTMEQRIAFLNSLPEDLYTFAKMLFMIGARPGELASANVSNYNRSAGTLLLPKGKTGPRTLLLKKDAIKLLEEQVKDKRQDDPLFSTDEGNRWTAPEWGRKVRESRDAMDMDEAVLYYARHTFITESLKQGIGIHDVAKYTGTSVEIIEKNYGHLTQETQHRINRVNMIDESNSLI
ncbi:tyrosine-type recombinase/integrase [Burkholderia sp. SIMBA_043]|uniref:tyrosine-type recombinase/integrase n=1 Tax=Burkholderia TaxID=32008 RepID=UPI00130D6D17|nr:tyrosine-type recombinase/integrase [Burkholderia vietnamiensis]UBI27577.1 tyrosine-type recombinase/integrase [Burkholderia vietnamiensis]